MYFSGLKGVGQGDSRLGQSGSSAWEVRDGKGGKCGWKKLQVKTQRFVFPAEIPHKISDKAESHKGDAKRFDYVPVSRLFPRFQNPPQKRF